MDEYEEPLIDSSLKGKNNTIPGKFKMFKHHSWLRRMPSLF